MTNINLSKSQTAIKLKSKRFFDKRGFFRNFSLKKYNLNIKFTALAYSKKCNSRYAFSIKKINKQN